MAAGGKIRMIRYKIRMMSSAAGGKIRMIRYKIRTMSLAAGEEDNLVI